MQNHNIGYLAIILSILICISGVGTLSFVDPIGRGGLKRLFKLDPSSLINFFTLTAVLLTAIGKYYKLNIRACSSGNISNKNF